MTDLWRARCAAFDALVGACRPAGEKWHESLPLSALVARHPSEYSAYLAAESAYTKGRYEKG